MARTKRFPRLLTFAVAVPALAAPAAASDVYVEGVVRDFRSTHADFDVVPAGGLGHYAGNLELGLGALGRPVFTGAGYKVATQWRDQASNPIAPHLYGVTSPAEIYLANAPSLSNQPVVDTYSSVTGAYGGPNVGAQPQWITGSPMPVVTEPTGMPALVNEFIRSSPGTTTISGNRLYNKFEITNGHQILISGSVVMQVNELFKLQNVGTTLELLPGATFTLYVKKDAFVQDSARLHSDTASPERVHIYSLTNLPFVIQNQAHACAIFVLPSGTLHLQDQANVYGQVTAANVSMQNQSGLHIDVGSPPDACGAPVADTAGVAGAASTGGITSAATFDHWYADALGVNSSMNWGLLLRDNGAGVFEYLDDGFHPIDGMLFGNEGQLHNNYFTFAIGFDFVYGACSGQFFEFEGADDAWLFVDGRLALDIGGVAPGTRQHVSLDRLGLADGQTYPLQFFYAHRNAISAIYRVRTSIEPLAPVGGVTISAPMD